MDCFRRMITIVHQPQWTDWSPGNAIYFNRQLQNIKQCWAPMHAKRSKILQGKPQWVQASTPSQHFFLKVRGSRRNYEADCLSHPVACAFFCCPEFQHTLGPLGMVGPHHMVKSGMVYVGSAAFCHITHSDDISPEFGSITGACQLSITVSLTGSPQKNVHLLSWLRLFSIYPLVN